jgi:hypothetical protein
MSSNRFKPDFIHSGEPPMNSGQITVCASDWNKWAAASVLIHRSTLNGDRGLPQTPRGNVSKAPLKGRGSVHRSRARCLTRNKDELLHDHNNDGVNRRGFLKCMAWAGTGVKA